MAEALLYGLAQEVLKTLGSKAFSEIASAWGFRTQLQQLKNSIDTVKDVLLDAEERQADDRAVLRWLERLTTVVYAADDLFDELNTLASRKQLMVGNTMSKEVRTFFSSSNQIAFPFKFSRKIEAIRQELDDIVKDSSQFQFVRSSLVGGKPGMSKRRNETYSFVKAEEVIGRDGDKKALLDMLIASTSGGDEHKHVVLPVVGIGGMGKTNLAQLIYNDPLVQDLFELRLWVCVSDVFGFDIKGITEKILMCATNSKIQKLDMQQLQGQLQTQVCDKKYFLVLDDVWNEDRDEWLKLRDLLTMGRKGSKILVTTRSRKVAKIMGTLPPYELQGLTEEKSWELFQKMAFEPGQTQQKPHLVQIGKEIVKKCANVPLAIRSLGSLLYGEDDRKWMSFKEKSLARISGGDQLNMMEILKLSYDHLWSPLKNCFAYCALFPKDYEFDTQMMIDLWMAEGFIIVDADESQGLEEVAEDYFLLLLQRCFFQDIKRDERGAIKSCKMHDLLHDLAQSVAGVKFKVASLEERNFDGKIIHVSHADCLASEWEIPKSMLMLKQLRTFLLPEQIVDGSSFSTLVCQQLILRFRCLRVLDLHNLKLSSLPSSIGKLIHLRYLNLSKTPIEELPDTISKLLNMQTLNLNGCWKLRILPTHIGRLVNLRSLDVGDCERLDKMPSQIGELNHLHTLPLFIANYNRSSLVMRQPSYAKLSDLKQLYNLRGKLHIKIEGAIENETLEATEANLTCKQLDELKMEFEI